MTQDNRRGAYCNNLGRRQWTLGLGRKSEEHLGLTDVKFSEVELERCGGVRMIPKVSDLSTEEWPLWRWRRLPARYQVAQRWREQCTMHIHMLGSGRIPHDTYERRTGNSKYKRINQTEAKGQNSTDEKGSGCSGRRSIVSAVARNCLLESHLLTRCRDLASDLISL